MEYSLLQNGSYGVDVRRWQLFLAEQGISMDDWSNSGDGIFGEGTEFSTKLYQQQKEGLIADGIVGAKTYAEAIKDGFDPNSEISLDDLA